MRRRFRPAGELAQIAMSQSRDVKGSQSDKVGCQPLPEAQFADLTLRNRSVT